MAVPSRPLSRSKQVSLLAVALGLWAFVVYIRWIATPDELLFIATTSIDKVAHLAGGLFLAMGLEWRFPRAGLRNLIFILLGVTLAWEALEFFFDVDTQFFYYNAFDLWLLDSIGDELAAFLGGYGHWVFLWDRPGAARRTG